MKNFELEAKDCLLKQGESIGLANDHAKRMRTPRIQWQFLSIGMAAKRRNEAANYLNLGIDKQLTEC
ncbi:hypothetical protein WH367_05355 [Comamonas sp. MYb21]|uniref:hypothetical protein n=1 Tax=Comamonas sp. MYb396 TaxID=2745302 RepID=UPI0030B311A5